MGRIVIKNWLLLSWKIHKRAWQSKLCYSPTLCSRGSDESVKVSHGVPGLQLYSAYTVVGQSCCLGSGAGDQGSDRAAYIEQCLNKI